MKFFICTLVACAFFLNVQSSVLPLSLNSPLLYSAAHLPGPIVYSTLPQFYNAPLYVPSLNLNPEGTYIAKTPGSGHIASLPGHVLSTSSFNLDQAAGADKVELKDSLLPSVAVHGSVIPALHPLSYSSFIVPAPIISVPTEATYVAKNLGIEHVAPLPGHSLSTVSLNLEKVPGSK